MVWLEDSTATYESRRWLGWNLCPSRDRARDHCVGEVGQLRTCENAYKNGSLPTSPTFFDALVGLEDSTAPYESRRWLGWNICPSRDRARDHCVGEVGQLQTCENAYKNGSLPTWSTFFRCDGGARRLHRTLRKQKMADDTTGWELFSRDTL